MEATVGELTLSESQMMRERMRWKKICKRYVSRFCHHDCNNATPFHPQVGSVLSNLKEMSQAMGGEIERQNKQLDKIGGKTDVADVNIDRANMRTQKLLK